MRRTIARRGAAGILGLGLLLTAVNAGPATPWAEAERTRPLDRLRHVAEVAAEADTDASGPAMAAQLDEVGGAPGADVGIEPSTATSVDPTTTTTAPAPRFTLEPYRGLGAWMDVYDWSATFAKGGPALEPDSVDVLAAQGVQTLFIQASKWDAPTDVLEPERLASFIERAHHHGIAVVGWYLPTLEDPARDLQRLLAIAALPIDGIAVDIEARNVGDLTERNRRLIELSARLRAALPGMVIGAIPLEPVLLEEVNPRYWPGFPWAEIAPHYDVWLPMSYWTNRRGGWRDGYIYTANNIDRIRHNIGQPGAPVHAIGGIGDLTTVEDLVRFRQAVVERQAIGGSIYDYRTTNPAHWPELHPLREPGR